VCSRGLFCPAFLFTRRRSCVLIVVFLHDVLNDQGNSPVRWIERVVRSAQPLIGEPTNLSDLVDPDSTFLHQAASGVRPIGRQFPIAIVGGTCEGLRVSVPFDREFVRKVS
jgi:hypothetical protein